MNKPSVSIVIPCFNVGGTLSETLDSIINQTYESWDAICIDDGSTDNTWDVIIKYSDKYNNIRGIKRQCDNKGGSVCRNIGIKHATGEYIIFLDGDDLLTPICLENRVKSIDKTGFKFVVWPYGYYKDGILGGNAIDYRIKNYLYAFAAGHAAWQTTSPIYSTDFVRSIGGFDESFQRLQDVEFGLRAVFYSKNNFLVMNKETIPDCCYRPNQKSNRNSKYRKALENYDKLSITVDKLEKEGLFNTQKKRKLTYTCLLLTAYQTGVMCNSYDLNINNLFPSVAVRERIGFTGHAIFYLLAKLKFLDNIELYMCRLIKRILFFSL